MVVDPGGHNVEVLADAFCTKGKCRNGYGCEANVAIAHEKVIPLNAERPVWSEAIFPADTGYSAPARFPSGVKDEVRSGDQTVIFVVCYGGTAFHVEQAILPNTITRLTREKADGINL